MEMNEQQKREKVLRAIKTINERGEKVTLKSIGKEASFAHGTVRKYTDMLETAGMVTREGHKITLTIEEKKEETGPSKSVERRLNLQKASEGIEKSV